MSDKTDFEKFRDASPENATLLDAEARVLAAEEACAALREENARLRERVQELEQESGYLRAARAALVEVKRKQREAEAKLKDAQEEVDYTRADLEEQRRNAGAWCEQCKLAEAKLARCVEEATILKYELGVEYDAALHRAKVSGRAEAALAAAKGE